MNKGILGLEFKGFVVLNLKENLKSFFISQLGEYSRNLAVRLQELQQELEITKGNNTPR